MRPLVPVLAAALALAPCRAAALDRNDVPFASPGGRQLLLDLHVPDGPGPFAAAIIVHGGGFDMGDKRTFVGPLFPLLTDAGFAWFTVNYRLAPDYKIGDAIDDVRSAVAWVRAHAAGYHVDPARLALIGESAGGYLAGYVGANETPDTRVAAVVDFYGPSDLVSIRVTRALYPQRFDTAKAALHASRTGGLKYFGVDQLDAAGRARLESLSPIGHVHAGMPAFLLIHGDADEQVPYEQSPAFCDAIVRAGASCRLLTIPAGRHGMTSWENDPAKSLWKPEMIAWLKSTLGAQ